MTITKTAQGAVAAAGPLVLAAGTAMLTVALASSQISRPPGHAALPGPTVAPTAPTATVTVTPRPAPTQVGRPPASAATATILPVIAFAHDPSSSGRGGGGSSSTAPPADPGTSPARCSSGQLVTVRIPLLPCNAVQIGGTGR